MKRCCILIAVILVSILLSGCRIGPYIINREPGVKITYTFPEGISYRELEDACNKLRLRLESYSTNLKQYTKNNQVIAKLMNYQPSGPDALLETGKKGELLFCTDLNNLDNPALTGNEINSTQVGTDYDNSYIVVLNFTDEGIQKFSKITEELAGTGKPLYIVYDEEVISSPTVNQQITSPNCQITGGPTLESAIKMAFYINIGALPAKADVELEYIKGKIKATKKYWRLDKLIDFHEDAE